MMQRHPLPRINFKRYRQRRFLVAVYKEFAHGRWWEGMSYARSHCPLCELGGKRGNRVGWWNFATGFFFCHNCKKTRDAIGMVSELMRCNEVKACGWLEEKAGAAESGYVPGTPSKN